MHKPHIEKLLAESNIPLSIEDILRIRYGKERLTPYTLSIRRADILKYLNYRSKKIRNEQLVENPLIQGHRTDGEIVWSDSKDKFLNDPRLDYYNLPLRELIKKYGKPT